MKSPCMWCSIWTTVMTLVLADAVARGDTWASPKDKEYLSSNGKFVFSVQVARRGDAGRQQCRGAVSRRRVSQSDQVWERTLVNRVCPVQAMVHDSGRFVVTFDEWHSVGTNPIVVYGSDGGLLAHFSLADLGLDRHPRITRSVSSYWWNEHAIMLFGPTAKEDSAAWQRRLEETLFIRLQWGDVLAIDLATGKVLGEKDRRGLSTADADLLAAGADAFLDNSYRQLANQYLRDENFFRPDPNYKGVQGILLAMQLRLREALPLLRRIAATERFESWAAPRWSDSVGECNLRAFAEAAIQEIEKVEDD